MTKRRKVFATILLFSIIVGLLLIWMLYDKKMMTASITSSNGARYTMLLPQDFIPVHLNDSAASLQYENKKKDLFILVIDESKSKIISFGLDYDLETYMKIAIDVRDVGTLHINRPVSSGANKGFQTDIRATVNNKKMVYLLTCFETPMFFYQILIGSSEKQYESNKDEIEKMGKSFHEIN